MPGAPRFKPLAVHASTATQHKRWRMRGLSAWRSARERKPPKGSPLDPHIQPEGQCYEGHRSPQNGWRQSPYTPHERLALCLERGHGTWRQDSLHNIAWAWANMNDIRRARRSRCRSRRVHRAPAPRWPALCRGPKSGSLDASWDMLKYRRGHGHGHGHGHGPCTWASHGDER